MRAASMGQDQQLVTRVPTDAAPTGTGEPSMVSVVSWAVVMGVSVGLLTVVSAGRGFLPMHGLAHLAIGTAAALLLAAMMVRDVRRLIEAGGSRNLVGAAKVRAIGSIWIWGALCLFATYGTGVLAWAHWWKFTMPFVLIGAACVFLSVFLKRGEEKGLTDEVLLKALSALARLQMLGMLAVMVSLVVSGRLMRSLEPGNADWAAFNILFCGALVLGLLSFFAVSSRGQARE